jgi:hypothetical protein
MRALSNYIGEELTLIQPSFFKREFEFRSSSELIATMYYPKFFSLTVVVEGLNEKYEIFRPNFWKSEIAIRKFGNELSFAALTTNFFKTKGTIDLQNGKKVLLKFGAFKRACDIFSESQELLVTIQTKFSIKDKNIVTIQKNSSIVDENPWMIMMIWYFLIESKKNGAVAS